MTWTSAKLRESFLQFFEDKAHKCMRSDNLVPQKDPSLLFTTAGMVQFKSLWIGAPLEHSRATTVQKCLRAGGKGSDLENVGKTLRHHTFFEMLGNFSFGDYFKEEAIVWAWEFITEVLKMDTERLWVSVYTDDDDAEQIWINKIGFPKERIVRLGKADNFWGPAGETGACGPCSEIHIDLGPEKSCGKPDCAVGCSCERYLEFWNLVFPQFDQQKDGSRLPLERRGIDTGMGLERLCYIMQNAKSNYHTDLFIPLISQLEALSGIKHEASKETDYALHVIADHIRALTFTFAENILPSNEGRGYVLRRILRRAFRYGAKLGLNDPFMHKLVPVVVDTMKEAYPELIDAQESVQNIVRVEEENFKKTLDYSSAILEELLEKAQNSPQKSLSGADVFKLYDTYGLPVDMIDEVCEEQGLAWDKPSFEQHMQEQKQRAKGAWKGGSKGQNFQVFNELLSEHGASQFVGYEQLECSSEVIAVLPDQQDAQKSIVLFKQSPFYGESGGQVGDSGQVLSEQGAILATVHNVTKPVPEILAHHCEFAKDILEPGQTVRLLVDGKRRQKIACNHTATHILHAVLREVLGEQIKQAGSLVDDQRLRFDFTCFQAIDKQQLAQIEQKVNEHIWSNAQAQVRLQSLDEAKQSGAIAFFDEKYGDQVRVVSLGDFSSELCGGTHLSQTAEIGFCKIVSESSVAAGTRRIEAMTGKAAFDYLSAQELLLKQSSALLKVTPSELSGRIAQLQEELRQSQKDLQKQSRSQSLGQVDDLKNKVQDVQGIALISEVVQVPNPGALKDMVDQIRKKQPGTLVALGASIDDKASFVVGLSEDLVKKGLHAGKVIKELAAKAGGSGGGRPDFAQAGSKQGDAVPSAIAAVPQIVQSLFL